MHNFRSKLFIFCLGIFLLVPAVYCFSIFGPSEEKVDEGQSDTSQSNPIDVTSPTVMNDVTKDTPIDEKQTTKDSITDDDDTTKDSIIDDDDTTKDSNGDLPSDDGHDTVSWPVIVVVEDNSALINAKSESGSHRVDSNNNWLVVNKRTRIRRVEEMYRDFGKNKKVVTEDKSQELRVYRDNLHIATRKGIDLTNILKL